MSARDSAQRSIEPTGRAATVPDSHPGRDINADEHVLDGLRVAAGYAWRVLTVAAAVYVVFVIVAKLSFVAVAVFVGLVIAALLRPVVDVLARAVSRGVAVLAALLVSIGVLGAVFTFIGNSVAAQSTSLASQFSDGLGDIERSLAGSPLHLHAADLTHLGTQLRTWVTHNSGTLAGRALGGAGVALHVLAGLVLAVFCSIFFLSSGERLWAWSLSQLGRHRDRWDVAARAGWATFAGYTRGVVLIAATNAVVVGLTLLILRVPLAVPLALLVFFAAFIPLIGSPIALAVATLVALAARGPLVALLVLALIVVIGELEGHVLQPLIMSRAVNLHPLAVGLVVASGTVLAGVVGAVVAVPLVAVAWTVWRTLRPDRVPQPLPETSDDPGPAG